jgi:hypothetical protein
MLVITNISFFLPLPLPFPPQPPFSLYPRSPSLALSPTHTDLGRHSRSDRRGGSRGPKPATQHVGPPSGPPRKGRAVLPPNPTETRNPKPEPETSNMLALASACAKKSLFGNPPQILSLSSCCFPLPLFLLLPSFPLGTGGPSNVWEGQTHAHTRAHRERESARARAREREGERDRQTHARIHR